MFVEKESILLTRIVDTNRRRCLWCGCTRSETPQFRCGPSLCGHVAPLCNRCYLQWQRDLKRVDAPHRARLTQREVEAQRAAREGVTEGTRTGPWSVAEVDRFDAAFEKLMNCPWEELSATTFTSYVDENRVTMSLAPLPVGVVHVKQKLEPLNAVYMKAYEQPDFVLFAYRRPMLRYMAEQISTRTFVQVKSRLQKQFLRVKNALAGRTKSGRRRKERLCCRCRGGMDKDVQKCAHPPVAANKTSVAPAVVEMCHSVPTLAEGALQNLGASQEVSDEDSARASKRKRENISHRKSTSESSRKKGNFSRSSSVRARESTKSPKQSSLLDEPRWTSQMSSSRGPRRKKRNGAVKDADQKEYMLLSDQPQWAFQMGGPRRKKRKVSKKKRSRSKSTRESVTNSSFAAASNDDVMDALIADLVGSVSTSDKEVPSKPIASNETVLPTDLPSNDFAMSLESELDIFFESDVRGLPPLPPMPMPMPEALHSACEDVDMSSESVLATSSTREVDTSRLHHPPLVGMPTADSLSSLPIGLSLPSSNQTADDFRSTSTHATGGGIGIPSVSIKSMSIDDLPALSPEASSTPPMSDDDVGGALCMIDLLESSLEAHATANDIKCPLGNVQSSLANERETGRVRIEETPAAIADVPVPTPKFTRCDFSRFSLGDAFARVRSSQQKSKENASRSPWRVDYPLKAIVSSSAKNRLGATA